MRWWGRGGKRGNLLAFLWMGVRVTGDFEDRGGRDNCIVMRRLGLAMGSEKSRRADKVAIGGEEI